MKRKRKKRKYDYSKLKSGLYLRLIGIGGAALAIVFIFYKLVWQGNGGDWLVLKFQQILGMDYWAAFMLYHNMFQNHSSFLWTAAIAVVFFLLLRTIMNWFEKYLDLVNEGIDALLSEDQEIRFPPEMRATEQQLREVQTELKKRALDVQLAEQRKNDLIVYLAHDIRTPLTSVIGYLNLLAEAPDMPREQMAKYVGITLDKAYRLEKMIDEFFEITRYHLQQITISRSVVDLYYMLVQVTDEISPVLAERGNTVRLEADENLTVYGDPDKLARVFLNVLKNAAAYSFPNTEILVAAEERKDSVVISFTNAGKTVPREKLNTVFEKFSRLDEGRSSNTGGAGLGLAIAKEIVTLHGGTIAADSEHNTVTFTVTLPGGEFPEKTPGGAEAASH